MIGGSGANVYNVVASNPASALPETNTGLYSEDPAETLILNKNLDGPGRLLLGDVENIQFVRDGNDLLIKNSSNGSTVLVDRQFRDDVFGISEIDFNGRLNSGSRLLDDLVNSFESYGGTLDIDAIKQLAWYRGTVNADYILDSAGSDQTFFGDLGDDILVSETGSDTYIYRRGDGNDTIIDNGFLGGSDRLFFEDVASSEVQLVRFQNDLIIQILTTSQEITVRDQFKNANSTGLEVIEFVDGSTLDRAQIADMVRNLGDEQRDALLGSSESDLIIGGDGNDLLSGSLGSDTYIYTSGDGDDTIYDVVIGGIFFGTDTLQLTDLNRDQILLERTLSDLFVTDLTTGQRILVDSQFIQETLENGIEKIVFANGEILNRAEIKLQSTFIGTDDAEVLTGTFANEQFDGNGGDDILEGAGGGDTYYYSSGDGNDTVNDGFSVGDRLQLRDLNRDQVELQRTQKDLFIIDLLTNHKITITDQFFQENFSNGVEEIVFASGEVLTRAQLREEAVYTGSDAGEVIEGTFANEQFDGNDGDDLLVGAGGGDTYYYSSGDGNDTINDISSLGDGLRLVDLNPEKVALQRKENDLIVVDLVTGEEITVTNQFFQEVFSNGIENIVFADGSTLNRAEIRDQAVLIVNEAPIVATPLADQSSPEDAAVSFAIPADAFSDVDGDELTYTAVLVGGAALPLWLTFDAAAGTFTGTPPQDFDGSLDIIVTASDGEFEASDMFTLEITPVNDAPILAARLIDQSFPEDEAVSFAIPVDTFADVDDDVLTISAMLADGSALPSWLEFDRSIRRASTEHRNKTSMVCSTLLFLFPMGSSRSVIRLS